MAELRDGEIHLLVQGECALLRSLENGGHLVDFSRELLTAGEEARSAKQRIAPFTLVRLRERLHRAVIPLEGGIKENLGEEGIPAGVETIVGGAMHVLVVTRVCVCMREGVTVYRKG